jgi:hypothetical protein
MVNPSHDCCQGLVAASSCGIDAAAAAAVPSTPLLLLLVLPRLLPLLLLLLLLPLIPQPLLCSTLPQGKIEKDQEVLLVIKTRQALLDTLTAKVQNFCHCHLPN